MEQEVGWQVYKSLCSGGEADARLVTTEKECPDSGPIHASIC